MSTSATNVDVPTVEWADFLARFRWMQGEHVSMIGPTGAGKTTLALQILDRRRLVCAFANKPKDSTMDKLAKQPGWEIKKEFKTAAAEEKVILWPKGKDIHEYEAVQSRVYRDALAKIWNIGYWCVFWDEVRYICDNLRLRRMCETYWMQARALKISIVAGTQRPAFVPMLMLDQATHLFFWCDNDEHNLKRIGGLGSINSKLVRETVAHLPKRTILYLNTRTGEMVQTEVKLADKKGNTE